MGKKFYKVLKPPQHTVLVNMSQTSKWSKNQHQKKLLLGMGRINIKHFIVGALKSMKQSWFNHLMQQCGKTRYRQDLSIQFYSIFIYSGAWKETACTVYNFVLQKLLQTVTMSTTKAVNYHLKKRENNERWSAIAQKKYSSGNINVELVHVPQGRGRKDYII